jgi:hypothetical protein
MAQVSQVSSMLHLNMLQIQENSISELNGKAAQKNHTAMINS